MSDVSEEDARTIFATMSACRARGIWRTTRHTDKLAALHRSRPPADQSGKRVASWTGKSSDTPDTLVAFSRGCRSCRAYQRRCPADAARKLLPWNLSYRDAGSRPSACRNRSQTERPGRPDVAVIATSSASCVAAWLRASVVEMQQRRIPTVINERRTLANRAIHQSRL